MLLVVDDLQFVLMEECPPVPASNASQIVRNAYDRWTKANERPRVYILASLFDVLAKKHEAIVIARMIIESLQEIFGQPSIQIRNKTLKFIYNA